MNLEEIWSSLKQADESPISSLGLRLPAMLRELSTFMLRAAPVVTRKDASGTLFELHPRPDLAGPRNWCWIMPVRGFAPGWSFELALAAGGDASTEHYWHVACGELLDLIALSPDCTRILGRMVGDAPVIGWPCEAYAQHDQDPEFKLRLYRSIDVWLRNCMQGVVAIGTNEELGRYLALFPGGVVCDDLAHGKAIDRLLRRPYAGPPVLVAA